MSVRGSHFPACNSITFKPIVVVGRMVVAKRCFPVCWYNISSWDVSVGN